MAESIGCTVQEAKERVSPQEFLDWLTFWETHPTIRDHMNVCSANIAHTIANCMRGKRQKALSLSKFLVDYEKAKKKSPKQVAKTLSSFLMGQVKKKG